MTLKLYKKELQFMKELAQNYINDTVMPVTDEFSSTSFVADKSSLSELITELEQNKIPFKLIDAFIDCLIYKPVSFHNQEKDRLFSMIVYKLTDFVEGRCE